MPQEFEYESRGVLLKPEKAILVGLDSPILDMDERSDENSMDELEALLETAGGVCVGRILQKRDTPDARTFIGKGKAREVAELAENLEAELLILDNDLAPAQARALEEETGLRVMDRSGLILDIFAGRARTSEGRLQVELAQYKYVLPRLSGMWTHLVRQTASGGRSPIGTRGPGETQLETDRRHIRRRLERLEEELAEVKRVRAVQRSLREKNRIKVVCLAGYTNAGKSTLMNAMTGADIPANNRLFDTLDTTTRRLTLPSGSEILLSDTVGFIRKLPHHLVQSFAATLEELTFADLILHVVDVSDENYPHHEEVVTDMIDKLGAGSIPVLKVYNKAPAELVGTIKGEDIAAVGYSAQITTGDVEELKNRIEYMLNRSKKTVRLLIPYNEAGLLDRLYKYAEVKSADYLAEGIAVTAQTDSTTPAWVTEYEVDG